MKRVLVLTDSLGLPRPKPEVVNYDETWPYKLSQNHFLHQVSIGGGTIKDIYTQIEYAKMFNPDVVIVQSGIVDCAPRAMTKFENELLNKFKLTKYFLKFLLKPKMLRFLRRKRNCTYTTINDFEEHILLLKNIFNSKLYWIGIVESNEEYEKIVPGVKKSIDKFNAVLKKQISQNFISLDDVTKKNIMSDHIHLSKSGHDLLFEKIIKKIA